MSTWMHAQCQSNGCQKMDGGCHEEHGGRCQLSESQPTRSDSATPAASGCGSVTGIGMLNTAKVESLLDHMALTCDCGSVRFALLRSDGIECHGCGMRMPLEWREYDATQCSDCCGKGWNDQWQKVTGHYMGGEVFREECATCGGLGWVGPEAEKRATLESEH